MNEYTITPLEKLIEYQKGQIIRLPDFAEGMPFYARLRRPSLLALTKSGKIPNSLLTTATNLFNGKGANNDDTEDVLPKMFDVLDTLCEAAFVEPTFEGMKKAGVELTDDQIIAVFNYTQQGVKALEPFRKESRVDGGLDDVKNVQKAALRNFKAKR